MVSQFTRGMPMNYTTLPLGDVAAELTALAGDAQSVFGRLSERQLNWRPDATKWSVAQCFDHLLNVNREMFRAIDAATNGSRPTIWQRLPVLPRVLGPVMIKSQMPDGRRKFKAPRKAVPAASALDARIIQRFVDHQHESSARVRALDRQDVAGVIMVSPFVSFLPYSVLDGCRLIAAHERRHFEQARRVTQAPGFPTA
jgi:hypothetical protein